MFAEINIDILVVGKILFILPQNVCTLQRAKWGRKDIAFKLI